MRFVNQEEKWEESKRFLEDKIVSLQSEVKEQDETLGRLAKLKNKSSSSAAEEDIRLQVIGLKH